MIPRATHISLKTFLNQMSVSKNIIATIMNKRTAFSMKRFARCSACVSIVIVETKHCIKSHIAFSRLMPDKFFESAVPGAQSLTRMIYNWIETIQET